MFDEANGEVPAMIRQGQLTDEIATRIPERVTGDWSRLEFEPRMLSMYSQMRIDVTFSDGTVGYALPPHEVTDLLEELRKVMYQEEAGTWFSSRWVLQKSGSGDIDLDVTFNFDSEPEWSRPISPSNYALDFEDFPRSSENVPSWLHERIQEAERERK
ncbi:agglutinin cell wall attachment protein [Brachybacterium endophyticum]|uniref:agglutinin cell wall attachment protein n=1 Tax=Brachybacterium endophyticum TaxID=2182385 RepID=UPI001057B819|nr:agglutinin cell wall attachment protein [Brachybacterium endophyticum]